MKIKMLVTGLMMAGSLSYAQGCWDVKESSELEFDELSEKITFSIKDAVDCKPIDNAYVNFNGVKLATDGKGEFSVPLGVLQDGQQLKVLIKKEGYISLIKKLQVEVGTIRGNKILMSKKTDPKSVRFVLSWSDKPRDMDLHLVADEYHISYQNKHYVTGKVKLDRDAMHGFGPETITLQGIDKEQSYTVYANRYSRSGEIDGSVELQVYVDNRLFKTVKLPKTDKKAVKVMRIEPSGVFYDNQPVDALP